MHNITVLVNSTATLECRTISDLEPHIEWIKFHIVDSTNPNIPENITKLEVPIAVSFWGFGGGYVLELLKFSILSWVFNLW